MYLQFQHFNKRLSHTFQPPHVRTLAAATLNTEESSPEWLPFLASSSVYKHTSNKILLSWEKVLLPTEQWTTFAGIKQWKKSWWKAKLRAKQTSHNSYNIPTNIHGEWHFWTAVWPTTKEIAVWLLSKFMADVVSCRCRRLSFLKPHWEI